MKVGHRSRQPRRDLCFLMKTEDKYKEKTQASICDAFAQQMKNECED
ncbi:hypothetical protein [Marivivens donghaensis]|nr:hypothetical protein [Marivivens donghaensis]MCL7408179.1 hypothetical protein [Marivivens donghaensis]MDN3703840.1 hypothetical protein [Marivivens donghaensis]